MADLENRVAVTPNSRFRIGSISKSLTAAALGRLVEQGKLDLDAPVQKYVPEFPKKKFPITTRQLAGHIAGIRHYRGLEFRLAKRNSSVTEGLQIFKDDALLFEPGTKYRYSSYGFNLVSAVVESVAKEPFLVHMRKRVFQPLGMKDTCADFTDRIIPNRVRFYSKSILRRTQNAPYVDNSYKWAGGGFLSTPSDLCRFASAHLGTKFLKSKTIKMLWTSQKTNDGKRTGYGIGWSVSRSRVGHGGGSVGGRSQLVVYPKQRVILAITANVTRLNYRNIHTSIAQSFFKGGRSSR